MLEKSTIEKIRIEKTKMQMNKIIPDLYKSYEFQFDFLRQPWVSNCQNIFMIIRNWSNPNQIDESKEKSSIGSADIYRKLLTLLGCRRGVRVEPVTSQNKE